MPSIHWTLLAERMPTLPPLDTPELDKADAKLRAMVWVSLYVWNLKSAAVPSSLRGRQPRQGRSANLTADDSKTSNIVAAPSSCKI